VIAPDELERPLCECHGRRMVRKGQRADGSTRWGCGARAVAQANAWRAANPERKREIDTEAQRRVRSRDPERAREVGRESQRLHRERHGDDVRAAKRAAYRAALEADREGTLANARRWYHANRERARENQRRWNAANPEHAAALKQRRRARIAGAAVNDLEGRHREALLLEYGDRCVYCGARGPLELEHDVPLSAGGDHTWRNVVPACRPCNLSKGTTTGAAFVLRRLLEA
jgi:5-methylcytosine-specific restriction endonuclease McrA